MNNMGTMAELIEAAMKKKKGDKDSFMMTGQYASPVMYEEDTSREFVIYEAPNGEEVKVYGSWNEYAVDVDDEGRDLIEDLDFPIIKNQDGDFILDIKKMEEQEAKMKAEQEQIQRENEAQQGGMRQEQGGQEEGAEEEMSTEEKLRMMFGGKMKYAEGGKMSSGDPTDPETLKNTILAKKRELLALKSRGYLSEEAEQNIKTLEAEIQELVKQARLMMRRKYEAERDSTFQPAAGGYMKPSNR